MAFRDSINDLMFRFYERFKQNNNRLPVSVDADINVGLEQKIDALKQSIESGVQLKGRLPALNATDPETGDPVPIQAVQDDAGNWVLGIVDRAPYAYDPVADATRVVLPTLVSGVYTRTNVPVSPLSSWSTDIIESGEAQRIRLTTFVPQRFHANFVDLNLEWYADADGQWRIVREVTGEPTGDPSSDEIAFENIKPIRGNAGIGTATVKGPYFRFTFFNTHESANYTIRYLAIHKFLDGGGVQLKGSLPPSMMELAVNDWSELPDPTKTPKGAIAQLIGTFDVRQNTGTEWVEVVL